VTDPSKLRPIVPDGTHLAYSKGPSGTHRALLFTNDTNELVGPAELIEVEDEDGYGVEPVPSTDEDDSSTLGTLVAMALIVAGAVAAPHIKNWWQEKAFPFLRMKWPGLERLARPAAKGGNSAVAPTQLALLSKTAAADFSNAVDAALEESKIGMSREAAQKRLAAMLAAAAFIAEQMRVLSNARIEDDAKFPELISAMERLTTQQVTDSINRLLEADASLLDDEISSSLVKFFGGGGVVDGEYVPLRNENVKELLVPMTRLASRHRTGSAGS
jgi:hypothetical protein